MRQGNEYLTSSAQVAYPFYDDALGLERNDTGTHGNPGALFPVSAFVDAVAYVPYGTDTLYLASITNTAPSIYRFVFRNASAVPVITADLNAASLAPTYVYSVITLIDSVTPALKSQIKLVIVSSILITYLAGCAADTFGTGLPFAARTVEERRRRIDTFALYTALPPVPEVDIPGPIAGNVKLFAGYNTDLTYEATDADITEVTIDCIAGAGEGVYPCAGSTPVVVPRFMGLIPDMAGNVNIVAGEENCYSINPTVVGGAAQIAIHNSCTACCTCEDYANVTKALKGLLNHADLIVKKLNSGRDTYQTGVIDFNGIIAGRYIGLKVRANGYSGLPQTMAAGTEKVDRGSPLWATVAIDIVNNTGGDVKINSFVMDYDAPISWFEVSCNFTYDSDGGMTQSPNIGIRVPSIANGKTLAMAMRLKATGVSGPVAWTQGTVTINYTTTYGDGRVPDPVTGPNLVTPITFSGIVS